ncbi:NAD(P)/FAD-dependent oxidoreductase [Acidaminobacter sp. JC074]|uniref:NAD(P)/FAD-dependent oxidoreductase n=1 Tax=Acidaminobacter sp. JC074 TaxID=2530199 RepID=UPI001F102F7B|nr:NAD(P)/FAD-dependent oxidoreductase [Acidaminobacter sp. JC074]MCH4888465.1 NAD(P)/FAD-dependent oxidoreductase [Acidaminobacter sp. JC074]
MYDFIIIGAGVVGAAIARRLSAYDCKLALIEKEEDVSLGASKANSGIVHGGYAGKYGTLKGQLCIKGNLMFDKLNEELNFGFKRIGGIVLGFSEDDLEILKKQQDNSIKVGQTDIRMLSKEEVYDLEPNLAEGVTCGMYVPSIGITSPYEMTIALVENALDNGLDLFLGHEVKEISCNDHFVVTTNKGSLKGKFIINAAGLGSGLINDMLGNHELTIHPRRGQYVLFGKDQNKLNHVLFQTPTEKGKGVLVTQTVHGNLMIGPDAEDLMDEVSTDTSEERLKNILKLAEKTYDAFNVKRALTTFSGIRAMSHNKDFFIKYVHDHAITVGGIDSPGLTSSPAIADYVLDLILSKHELTLKSDFNPIRNSYYSIPNDQVICLCEQQGQSRIEACLEGPIEIKTTDGVKRRIRAGMGNCQGKRCEAGVRKMIADHHQMDEKDVLKRTERRMPKRVPIEMIRNFNLDYK